MISRLTATAVLFAVVATASLATVVELRLEDQAATAALPVVQLERVEIVGRRAG